MQLPLKPVGRHTKRTVRDVVLIVVGVLIATAADVSWASRQERNRAIAEMQQMLAATRENAKRLQEAIFMDSIASDHAERAIWALRSKQPAPIDSINAWIMRSVYFSDLHPVTGPFQEVISAGDLSLLPSAKLRDMVPQFISESEGTSSEMRVFDQQATANVASMSHAVDFVTIFGAYNGKDGIMPTFRHSPQSEGKPIQPLPLTELQNNADLERALMNCYVNGFNRAFLIRRLRALNAEVAVELASALKKAGALSYPN